MSIATRRGDGGETDLLFGCRLSKSHPRVHALGAVDELNAALGVARAASADASVTAKILAIQKELVVLMGGKVAASETALRSADATALVGSVVGEIGESRHAPSREWPPHRRVRAE